MNEIARSVRPIFIATLTLLICALVTAPLLFYPFGRDQAAFAYIGHLVAGGGMPYRDAWDIKPPGVYLLFGALATFATDTGYSLLRWVNGADFFCTLGCCAMLIALGKKLGSDIAGFGAALWYAVLYYAAGYWCAGQAEAWANAFVIGVALLLFTKETTSRKLINVRYFFAGVLASLAFVIKYTSMLPALPFVVYGLFTLRDRALFYALCSFAVGGILIAVACIGWLMIGHALDTFEDIQRHFLSTYAVNNYTSLAQATALTGGNLLHYFRLSWLPFVCFGLTLFATKRSRRQVVLIATALATGMLAVVLQNKFLIYHWLVVLPWLSIGAAWGLVNVLSQLRLRGSLCLLATLLLPMIWFAMNDGILAVTNATRYATGRVNKHDWYERFANDFVSFVRCDSAAAYLHKHTQPDDLILNWGYEPSLYLLSERNAANRFFFNIPLRVSRPYEPWKVEFINAVQTASPKYIVVSTNDFMSHPLGLNQSSYQQLPNWKAFYDWLRINYDDEGNVSGFEMYRFGK